MQFIVKFLGILFVFCVIVIPNMAEARVIIKEKIRYYNVSGKTGAQLAHSIGKKGPRANRIAHAMASTFWDFDLKNPKYTVVGNRCKVQSVDVHVLITYTYPKWRDYHKGSKELQKRWDKFISLVEKHEKRHGKIFSDGSHGLERSLKRASGKVSKNCKDFYRSFQKMLRPVVLSTHHRNAAFDRREGLRWSKVRIAQRLLEGTN